MKTKSHAIVLLGSLVMFQQNVEFTCYCNNGYSGEGVTSIHTDVCLTDGDLCKCPFEDIKLC